MKIIELTTPLERRRMIEYGADGNKTVRHWYNVRRAAGNMYVTEPEKNEWGDLLFSAFLILPGVPDGLTVGRGIPERVDVAALEECSRDAAAFLAELDEKANSGRFIGNAVIEFVRQFDAARAERYAEARRAFYERREAQDQERRERAAAEAAEAEKRKQEEDAAARAIYRGYADKMTALQFGRVDKILSERIRENGIITTRREWIDAKIAEGCKPDKMEGVTSYYGNRWERKESKPKTVYRLLTDTNLCYTISKTEYDYAAYLAARAV